MTNSNKPKRAYNSTRRQAQAQQTRQQIAEAARQLFSERSYAGATIEAIAESAGVAAETIYAVFGSKQRILNYLLDIALGGDDSPIPMLERQDPQAMFRETDQRQQLGMFARGITGVMDRAAPIFEIMRMAAKSEPPIATLLQHLLNERRKNMETVIQHVAANGALREGISNAHAADIVWTLTSAEVFLLLTVERGWSREHYSEWLADSLIRLLLP
ncbi:MAG: helix-turn-helix transcriptional regulator [Anaerolineae bacterium]|nr:helix-turn-helix transcriptional regulator [Anaerolineae bacterium]